MVDIVGIDKGIKEVEEEMLKTCVSFILLINRKAGSWKALCVGKSRILRHGSKDT